jgi:AraC-like DNA-binding protein
MHVSPQVLHKTPQRSVQCLRGGSYEAIKGRDFPSHTHQHWELVYYRSGRIGSTIGETLYKCQPGMLIVIPPGVVHDELAWTGYSNYYIHIEADEDQPWPKYAYDDLDNSFGNICRQIVSESNNRKMHRSSMIEALTTQFDILLQRSLDQEGISENDALVKRAEQILSDRYTVPISIKEVAHELGISPSHLRAQFVRLRGYTPISYLQKLRIQRAVALLHTSDLTLEIIAGLCGYHSASHLSRHFKQIMGKSPGALRES